MRKRKKQNMADILRKAFAKDKRSIFQMARDSGVPYPVLHRFIKGDKEGHKPNLNLLTFEKLANELGYELQPKKEDKDKRG